MARRLLATYLTITSLVLAVVVIPLGITFAGRERDRLISDIERDAVVVASLAEDALEAGTSPSLGTVLASYAVAGGRIVVVDREGLSVADSEAETPRDFSTRPEIGEALEGRRASGTRPSETLGNDLVFVAIPVASGGTVHGAVRITYPTSTLDARTRGAWLNLALVSLSALAAVAAVGLILASQVSKPVRELEEAARRFAVGDLSMRVPTDHGAPELRALATTFNLTADRLTHLVEDQRRFAADAAHQLRTPLAALRLRLETLEPSLTPDQADRVQSAIGETVRLGRLVDSLLAAARSGVDSGSTVVVDLAEVACTRVDLWREVAAEEDVSLEFSGPGPTMVHVLDGAVEQILDNLLANALAAAPPASSVRVAVEKRGGIVELHVIDSGPGMSAEDRTHAFERFWRGEAGGREGFGLGLGIVADLARACGAAAVLLPAPEGDGLDAVVRFPAQPR